MSGAQTRMNPTRVSDDAKTRLGVTCVLNALLWPGISAAMLLDMTSRRPLLEQWFHVDRSIVLLLMGAAMAGQLGTLAWVSRTPRKRLAWVILPACGSLLWGVMARPVAELSMTFLTPRSGFSTSEWPIGVAGLVSTMLLVLSLQPMMRSWRVVLAGVGLGVLTFLAHASISRPSGEILTLIAWQFGFAIVVWSWAYAEGLRRRMVDPFACTGCGYDLRGLIADASEVGVICPECGVKRGTGTAGTGRSAMETAANRDAAATGGQSSHDA